MSLPFMKPKHMVGVIMSTRKADGGKVETGNDGEEGQGLMACAEDLVRAIHAKDSKAVAQAFRAAFEILELEPHAENEDHDVEPHSYDAQNIKAAQER